MNDANSVMREYETYRRERKKLAEANKRTIFKALAAALITEVRVAFDGEGDSGQIDSITAINAGEETTLPAQQLAIRQLSRAGAKPIRTRKSLAAAIETLCYDYLAGTHAGWENNEGAFGEFHIDVADRTIKLEFNARFVDVDTTNHTF
jgi:uncharacterized protein DUF6878